MSGYSLFYKIRRNIFVVVLFMLVLETALFFTVYSLQKNLAEYKHEQKISETRLKSVMNTMQKHNSVKLSLVKDSREGVEIIKKLCSENKISVRDIAVLPSEEYTAYKMSGESGYADFVRFLSAVRKSREILRTSNYTIKFTDNGKVDCTIEIQTMKSSVEKTNVK